ITFTRHFKSITKNDAALAGGKGASLGEMTRAGIPVPPGFVILAGAFEQFIGESGLGVEIDAALDSVNADQMHTVEGASKKIQALILAAEIPSTIKAEIENEFRALRCRY